MLQAPVGTGGAATPLGHPHPFLSPTLATRSRAATTEEERAVLVTRAKAEAVAFLQNQPSWNFLSSPFYGKFPQWKGFEMQPGWIIRDCVGVLHSMCPFTCDGLLLATVSGPAVNIYAQACAGRLKNTGKMYACKKLDRKRPRKKNGEKMALWEKEILERISSPFAVSPACAFGSKSHLCLVVSLTKGGDLELHIYSTGTRGLALSTVAFCSAQVTCGLLHPQVISLSIVCRGLKPEDVLPDHLGNCRLDDLGNSRMSDLGLAVQT